MLEVFLILQGKDAISFLETLIVGDIASLEDRTGTLSVFTNEKGGIIDDSVITKARTGEQNGHAVYAHTHHLDPTRHCNSFAWPHHAVLPEGHQTVSIVQCKQECCNIYGRMVSVRLEAASAVPWDLQVNSEDAYVVLNAGCRDKDIEHIQGQLKKFQVSNLSVSKSNIICTLKSQCILYCCVRTLYYM